MKLLALVLAFSTLVILSTKSDAKVVTLAVQNYNGITNETAEVVIEDFELAEVLMLRDNQTGGGSKVSLTVLKDQKGLTIPAYSTPAQSVIFVAGPARLRLGIEQPYAVGFCTVRITPEAYPPDRSVLVAPGAGGAAIALECSTNLVNWTAATNGVYTNLPVAKFFRIRADRISGTVEK